MSASLRLHAARVLVAFSFLVMVPGTGATQTVADVQAELLVLNGQVQQLRDQLVQQGASGGLPVEAATAVERVNQMEDVLRRLTGRVEVLTNDLDRIVADASNRIGDIEFRLTELEGGDTSIIVTPGQLGGGVTLPRPRPRTSTGPVVQLAATEKSDFDAAKAAAAEGNYGQAVVMFDAFLVSYPGGPLSSEAQYYRSEALAADGDWSAAARSYLDAFSGNPQGELAPKALFGLAQSLASLGQVSEACLTYSEVMFRYPESNLAADVVTQRASLSCP